MLTNWEDPFVVQWMDQNRARFADNPWGLLEGAKAAFEERERAQAQAAGTQMVPQDVVNYFQNLQQSQSNTYNPDGREWFAIGADGGRYLGGNPVDISGYRQSTEYGRPVSEVGNADNYFDANGIFQNTQKNERSATWGELVAQLAGSVAGIGVVGAAAGVPLGTAGAAGGGAAMGTNGAFLGEGVSSGIGVWDGAMTTAQAAGAGGAGAGYGNGAFLGEGTQGAGVWGADGSVLGGGTTAMGASGSGGVPAGGGTPAAAGGGGAGGAGASGGSAWGSVQNILNGTGSASDWLGLAATVGGGLLGSQGEEQSETQSFKLDPRLDSAVYGGLLPNTMGTMGSQIPVSQGIAAQLNSVGSNLLNTGAPNMNDNPYVQGILNDLQRRQNEVIGTNLQNIRGNAVGVGALGGSRQGIAESEAISKGADNFTGQAANLLGSLYNQDQSRVLQKQTLGAGLLAQGQQAPWVPLTNTSGILGNFKSGEQTTTQSAGGGWSGALGGLLGGAQWAQNAGLFSNNNSGSNASKGWW